MCPPGFYAPSTGLAECLACGVGMFSYRGASSCEACPQEGVECAGGVVTLEPGYWRQDSGQPVGAHSLFLPCPNTASCVVNTEWSSNLVGPQHGTTAHQLPPHNETGTLPYAHSHVAFL